MHTGTNHLMTGLLGSNGTSKMVGSNGREMVGSNGTSEMTEIVARIAGASLRGVMIMMNCGKRRASRQG